MRTTCLLASTAASVVFEMFSVIKQGSSNSGWATMGPNTFKARLTVVCKGVNAIFSRRLTYTE